MLVGATRGTVQEKLADVLKDLRQDRDQIEQLRNELLNKHNILPATTQQIINGDLNLSDLDLIVLCLLNIKLWEVTDKYPPIDPNKFFTEKEIKSAKRYEEIPEEKMTFPLIIEDTLFVNSDEYFTKLTAKQLVEMYESKLIEYNFETQRNPKFIRKKNTVVMAPNINTKSVEQIADKLNDGSLLSTTLTLNLLSDGTDEFHYDERKKQLIIEAAEIDILDGFHRLQGTISALRRNPDIDFNWHISIRNYSTRKAQSFFIQANTINKVDKGRTRSLKQDTYTDVTVKELMLDSDLKGRVSLSSRPSMVARELVSYTVMTDAIDRLFKLESKKEAMDLAEYLTRFFDYLVGYYPKEFKDEAEKYYKKSLINNNVMFVGYLTLAKRFKEENISIKKLPNILDSLDFSKDNLMWEQKGILEQGKLTKNVRQKIMEFFNKIEIKEMTLDE